MPRTTCNEDPVRDPCPFIRLNEAEEYVCDKGVRLASPYTKDARPAAGICPHRTPDPISVSNPPDPA